MKIRIYDMDGTIVDSAHRYRTAKCGTRIDLDHWRENQHLAMNDKLLPLAKQYQADIASNDVYVIIATARVMNDPDYLFVNEILGKPDYLISRKEGDNQSGKTLKIKGLTKFFNLKQFSADNAIFFEDNFEYLRAVCEYFKIRGVYIPSTQGH